MLYLDKSFFLSLSDWSKFEFWKKLQTKKQNADVANQSSVLKPNFGQSEGLLPTNKKRETITCGIAAILIGDKSERHGHT